MTPTSSLPRRSAFEPGAMRPLLSLSCVFALFTIAGCSGGGSGGGSGSGGAVAGSLIVLAPNTSTLEAEPNDTLAQGHVLGSLAAGETRAVLGAITDAQMGGNPVDPFDVFRFTATQRMSIALQLITETMGADLDAYIVDPVGFEFVERFDTNAASEAGTFIADGAFFVVIRSFSGASTYELRLTASAAPATILEAEPNDLAGEAMYLGVLTDAETIDLAGTLGGSDAADRFLVAVPAAGPFSFSLTHAGTNDFDVTLSDATADVLSPTVIQNFIASTSPEVGQINVAAMTLIEVRIFPAGVSAGSWQMTLQAGTMPRLGGGEPPVATLSAAPRGDVVRQARRMRGGDRGARVGTVTEPVWSGDLIVGATPSAGAELDARLAARGGRTVARVPGGVRKVSFELPAGLDEDQRARYTLALATALEGSDGVAFAEPDFRVFALRDLRPNDPHFNLQWHYEQIQLPAAWMVTQGDAAVTVAVLDTGSTPHPDLVAREVQGIDMISSPAIAGDGNGIDNDPFDVGDSPGTQPSSFHGSHVAGTIGAATNNGAGVAGVTWFGGIMHVRVLGIGGGSTFDILNGILYAARLANASNQLPGQAVEVINMSLGGAGYSQATQNAINSARAAGVVIVAAAGNENSSQPSYPAAYDGVISVAAVDFESRRAPYSNFHATVDIAAPGGDVTRDRNGDGYADGVLSTKPDDSVNPTNYTTFAFYQGTSMAAPHVAGVAALILAVTPTLTPAEVEAILTSTATDLGTPGRDDLYGHGLVNAFAAVQAAGSGGGGMPPVLSLASSSVLFTSRMDTARIGVANVGGGMLDVHTVSASTSSGGAWLSAAPVAVVGGTATNTSAVDVTVDATGLVDGFYSGSVSVQSTGGNVALGVTLALGASGSGPVYNVYVLAIDATSFNSIAEVVVQTSALVNGYQFQGLPPGDYLIVAGTDEDNDGYICDPGEPLCGVYPTLEQPTVVTVSAGSTFAGADFPLDAAFLPASTSSGYRRVGAAREVGR